MLNIVSVLIVLFFASQVQAGTTNRVARINLTVRPDITVRLNAVGLHTFRVKINCMGGAGHTFQSQSPLVPVINVQTIAAQGCDTDPSLRPQASKFVNWELLILGMNGKVVSCGLFPGTNNRDNNPVINYDLNGCPTFDIPVLEVVPTIHGSAIVPIPIPNQAVVLPAILPIPKGPIYQTGIQPAILPIGKGPIYQTGLLPPIIPKIAPVYPAILPVIAPLGPKGIHQNGFFPGHQKKVILKAAIGVQNNAYPALIGKSGYPPIQAYGADKPSDDLI